VKLTWNPSCGIADDKEAYVLCTLKGTRIEPEGTAEKEEESEETQIAKAKLM
jgi:hypothetical protein